MLINAIIINEDRKKISHQLGKYNTIEYIDFFQYLNKFQILFIKNKNNIHHE